MQAIVFKDEDFRSVEQLKAAKAWPQEFTMTRPLAPYINRIRNELVSGIEIGTGRGEGTYYILENCPKVGKLVTIDPFMQYDDWVGTVLKNDQFRFEKVARKNLEGFGPRVEMIKKKSDDAVTDFVDEDYDFVIIDGDHAAEQVYRDCKNYYPKLRRGGIFAVHDHNLMMVREGLLKWRDESKVRIPLQMASPGLVFWYKA